MNEEIQCGEISLHLFEENSFSLVLQTFAPEPYINFLLKNITPFILLQPDMIFHSMDYEPVHSNASHYQSNLFYS